MQVAEGQPYKDYEEAPGLRASQLALIRESPALYRHHADNPSPRSAAMDIGTATHTAVLQPDQLRGSVEIMRVRKTDHVQAARDAGKAPLRENEWEQVRAMRDAVLAHPHAKAILDQSSYRELSLYWSREVDAGRYIECKARLDLVSLPLRMVVDLKTSRSIEPQSFSASCWRYGYHLAAYWYLHAAKLHGWNVSHFAWIVVEKTPPHPVAVYIASEKMMHAGRIECVNAVDTFLACEDSGKWVAKVSEITELDLPRAAYEKLGIS
jgi:exodeoxyribonuclease VIII